MSLAKTPMDPSRRVDSDTSTFDELRTIGALPSSVPSVPAAIEGW